MVRSRLKYSGQREILLHDGNGGKAKLVACAMLEGRCAHCNGRFWVESRIGDMACPYCRSLDVLWAWGKLGTAFIPERGGKFFGPHGQGKGPK